MTTCPSCQSEVTQGAHFCPNCGGAVPMGRPAEDVDPLLGKVIARNFRVESLLGTGGMGRVYKARQLSLDKPVVLKILHPHFNDDPQLVQRFHREARAASRLNHPNSISIIDFGQSEDGTLFMAMELLHGRDLFTVLQQEFPLEEERLGRILIQVCSALAEAHEQNIIHRDIKPENIMVEDRRDHKDFVKVLDFGIAKIQDPSGEDGRALTQQGMVCGTPEYMSPEQARGENLDARSDVYALGVLTYQMVTGDLPFKSESPVGIVTKHITELPIPPSRLRPDLLISPEVEAIILKCMEKVPDRRFQTAMELGAAWKRLLEGPRDTQPATAAVGGPVRRQTLRIAAPAPGTTGQGPVQPSSSDAALGGRTPHSGLTQPEQQPPRTATGMGAQGSPPPVIPLPDEGEGAPSTGEPSSRPLGLYLAAAGGLLLAAAGGYHIFTTFQSGDGHPANQNIAAASSGPAPSPVPPNATVGTANAPDSKPQPAPGVSSTAPSPPPAMPNGTATSRAARGDVPPGDGQTTERPEKRTRKDRGEGNSRTADTRTSPQPSASHHRGSAAGSNGDSDQDARAAAIRELVQRAERRMQVGDYEEAIQLLLQARKAAPRDAPAARLLGDALTANGDNSGACSHWREFLKIAPRDPKAPGVKNKYKAAGCDDP